MQRRSSLAATPRIKPSPSAGLAIDRRSQFDHDRPRRQETRGVDARIRRSTLSWDAIGEPEPTERSPAPITLGDLARLAELAKADRDRLFARNRPLGARYAQRMLAVALCRGAALHYLDVRLGEVGAAGDGWTASESAVGPMVVIPVQPGSEGGPAGRFAWQ
jgi:hypothetical protein